jgi:hypothetical protein
MNMPTMKRPTPRGNVWKFRDGYRGQMLIFYAHTHISPKRIAFLKRELSRHYFMSGATTFKKIKTDVKFPMRFDPYTD